MFQNKMVIHSIYEKAERKTEGAKFIINKSKEMNKPIICYTKR